MSVLPLIISIWGISFSDYHLLFFQLTTSTGSWTPPEPANSLILTSFSCLSPSIPSLVYRWFWTICKHHPKVEGHNTSALHSGTSLKDSGEGNPSDEQTNSSRCGCSLWLEGEMMRHMVMYWFLVCGQSLYPQHLPPRHHSVCSWTKLPWWQGQRLCVGPATWTSTHQGQPGSNHCWVPNITTANVNTVFNMAPFLGWWVTRWQVDYTEALTLSLFLHRRNSMLFLPEETLWL